MNKQQNSPFHWQTSICCWFCDLQFTRKCTPNSCMFSHSKRPTLVLPAPCEPHVGPVNFAIREVIDYGAKTTSNKIQRYLTRPVLWLFFSNHTEQSFSGWKWCTVLLLCKTLWRLSEGSLHVGIYHLIYNTNYKQNDIPCLHGRERNVTKTNLGSSPSVGK